MVGATPTRHPRFDLGSKVDATVERAAPHFDERWNSIMIDVPGDGPAGREPAA
jgi:hypothetical protein